MMIQHRHLQRLLPFLLLPTFVHSSFSSIIAPGEEECFLVRIPNKAPCIISGNFDMLDDGLSSEPIGARLENEEKVLWTSKIGTSEGTFELTIPEGGGIHHFCLENGKHFPSDGLDRSLGWAVRVRNLSRALDDKEAGPDGKRAQQLVEWASTLQEEWATLLDHYGFLRTREGVHTELTDAIMGRVVRWTIFEGITLTLIAAGQILYLRKFMETRRYL